MPKRGSALILAGCCAALLSTLGMVAPSGAQLSTTPTSTPTTTPAPVAPVAMKHALGLVAKLRIKSHGGAFVGTGPVSGPPFGGGTITSRSVITRRSPLRTATTLTARYKTGTVVFKGVGHYVGRTFEATMTVTGGTGAYRAIKGSKLTATDVNRNGIDTLRLQGAVTYSAAAGAA